jgi:hypothetical protein
MSQRRCALYRSPHKQHTAYSYAINLLTLRRLPIVPAFVDADASIRATCRLLRA